jgi:formylglycine-generating enzyme required for sulfatase activity
LTTKKNWTPIQQQMMRQAGRVHSIRFSISAMVLLAIVVGGFAIRNAIVADRADALVEALLVAAPQAVPYAVENLTSVRAPALPILRQRVAAESGDASHRLHAAVALAYFGEVDVPFIVSTIGEAQVGECSNIVSALRRDPAAASSRLKAQLELESESKGRLRLVVVALHLGEAGPAQQMLALAADPSQRTLVIHELHQWRGNLADYAPLLKATDDADFQSGLCLALGQIPVTALSVAERKSLEPVLRNLYATCPHAPTHSAARWAMQQWKLDLPLVITTKPTTDQQGWYVNQLGMTFLKIKEGKFLRKDGDGRELGKVALSQAMWLGDCEVTRQQFETFIADPNCPPAEKPVGWTILEDYSPTADCPVNKVSWLDAVLFCNWLSHRERLRPCYERTGEKHQDSNYLSLKWDVWRSVPGATGYRLPTEAEWDYACRAKSGTLYCYGDDESLLSEYAVYSTSKTQPVGSRLPNGWGLFDMHGNLREWNQDWYAALAESRDETINDPTGPATADIRVLRGGSFINDARDTRSASRYYDRPTLRNYSLGFRVARTYP